MKLGELLRELPVLHTGADATAEVSSLAYNSREVGPGTLFFAIQGEKADGHAYIPQALERGAVAAAIGAHGGVLGLGGGAVLDEATQAQLAGQTVVYLETGFSELAKRVGLDRPRPLLLGNPRAQLKALLEQRLPVYARLAQITVRTDGRDPAEIAGQIAAHVSGPGSPAAPADPAGPEGRPGPAGNGRPGP